MTQKSVKPVNLVEQEFSMLMHVKPLRVANIVIVGDRPLTNRVMRLSPFVLPSYRFYFVLYYSTPKLLFYGRLEKW